MSLYGDFIRVCAWCKRIEHDGKWISFDEFVKELHEERLTHGICNDCKTNVIDAEIKETATSKAKK